MLRQKNSNEFVKFVLGGLLAVLALFAAVFFSSCTASAYGDTVPMFAGGWGSGLGDYFDLGDINGGYSTSSNTDDGKTSTQLYAQIGGQHKITNSSISFYPYYWYTYDDTGIVSKTQNGYQICAYISGIISEPLTLADIGSMSQYNSFNARGISIGEGSWINTYKSSDKDGTYEIFSNAGSNMNISNFVVTSASGYYNEYTWGEENPTCFNYNVSWYGDFTPGTLPSGMVAPSLGCSVPEPGMWYLILTALSGLGVWRFKR